MQATDIPSKISIPFANSGTKRTIPNPSQIGITDGAASFTDGFPPKNFLPLAVGGVPPSGSDFNGILNMITAIQKWQSAGGLFKFDSAFATAIGGYPKGSRLSSSDGLFIWLNQSDNNTTDPEGATPSGWVPLQKAVDIDLYRFMTPAQIADVNARTYLVDVTSAVQAALDYAANLPGGGRVHAPAGVYWLSAPLNIKANVYLYGDGQMATLFRCTHAGDFLHSSFPINSSTAANINVRDLGAYTTVASTGAGYADVGGTYINVENCFFQSFKYNVVLDQSELVVVQRNYFLSWLNAGVWIVNGPDHTAGANKGFTNRISIINNQFNGNGTTGYCIQDDGGGNHLITGNNFNVGNTQVRLSGVTSLTLQNNEFEGAGNYPVYLTDTTVAGTYVGPVAGFNIQGNGISGGPVSIYMDAADGGDIVGNVVYQYTTCAFEYNFAANSRVTNVHIGVNNKVLRGAGRTDKPFFSDPSHKAYFASVGRVDIMGETYCNQAPAAGSFVTTPISMEDITEGCLLRVMNADGTNAETVQASAVTGTTFTATYASAKAAGFLIFVMQEQPAGTWTPTPYGSATAGAFTTSTCKGVWEKKNGRVFFNKEIVWSATTSTGQMNVPMPFKSKANGVDSVFPVSLTGPGAIGAGIGQIFMYLTAGSASATLVYLNTSTGNFSALQCPASGSMYVNGSYENM